MTPFTATVVGLPTPTELSGGRIVTVREAQRLMQADTVVIDVRSAINFGRGHIPGAVLAPDRRVPAPNMQIPIYPTIILQSH